MAFTTSRRDRRRGYRTTPFVVIACGLMLQGCLAKAALDVATAPVRVVSKAVDLATTSQSESDEKRGRDLRKRQEELGKLERRYAMESKDCDDGSNRACRDARGTYAKMQEVSRTLPATPQKPEH